MTTRQRTRTDFLCLTISAGEGVTAHRDGRTYNRYNVSVASDATGGRCRFTYHDSQARYDDGIDQLDREHLLYAFWSFCRDADTPESFAEFCDDFGYDDDSLRARRTWQACRAARTKFDRLFHDKREPSFVVEQLAAEGIE